MAIDPIWCAIAAGLCAMTFLIYTIIGTKEIYGPARSVAQEPGLTLLYAWNLTSLGLLILTLMFVAPLAPLALADAWRVFMFAEVTTIGYFLISVVMNVILPVFSWKVLPQWMLFGAISVSGALALK